MTLVRSLTVAKLALDRIRRAQVPPVLGREVEERGERVPVLVELGDRLGVLGVELVPEALKRLAGVRPCGRPAISCSSILALGCSRFGSASRTFAVL